MLRPEAGRVVREMARRAAVYCVVHVLDDLGEATVLGALEAGGLVGAGPGQVRRCPLSSAEPQTVARVTTGRCYRRLDAIHASGSILCASLHGAECRRMSQQEHAGQMPDGSCMLAWTLCPTVGPKLAKSGCVTGT